MTFDDFAKITRDSASKQMAKQDDRDSLHGQERRRTAKLAPSVLAFTEWIPEPPTSHPR